MAEENSKRRLGRGLAALIGENEAQADAAQTAPESPPDRTVPVEHVRANPKNPRRHFAGADLEDLARSISEHGIVQPILVRPISESAIGQDLGGARYEIVAGERRWRAAQRAGLHGIPVIIRELADRQALEIAIIENVQRADLGPIEEANGYQQLIDEYDYSQADLAQVIGKSRSHVANTLRLLKLPDAVHELLQSGEISAGHARTLIGSADPVALASRIVSQGLSVRQAEALAQGDGDGDDAGGQTDPGKQGVANSLETKSADVKALEKQLGDLLGLKVKIAEKQGGAGELRIRYRTLEQLDGVCRRLENGF